MFKSCWSVKWISEPNSQKQRTPCVVLCRVQVLLGAPTENPPLRGIFCWSAEWISEPNIRKNAKRSKAFFSETTHPVRCFVQMFKSCYPSSAVSSQNTNMYNTTPSAANNGCRGRFFRVRKSRQSKETRKEMR